MPSTAEINAQNEASRARQQANRGIVAQAPQQVQQQSPWINPYGTQYGTDSIQDQSYYDNYYNDNSGDSMTDEEWFAYLAMLDEQSQQDSNYSSEYGSRMPDGPIDYAPNAPVYRRAKEPSIYDNMMENLSESRFGKYLSGITTYDLNSGGNVVPGSGNREFPNLAERNQVPEFGSNIPQQAAQQAQQQEPQPEPQSPFLQSLNMERGSEGSPQSNYYNFVQGGGQMNDDQLRQANEMAMSMGTTFDPETGYSRQPYLDQQNQAPQVQAPMSVRDTRAMLQDRYGSPTISGLSQSNQDSRNFYDEQSQLRMQRDENRPDFGSVTRDIDKYDNRRSFAEARKLVPTERDKYGNITNKEQQRRAMALTDQEVRQKKSDEYLEDSRAKNLELLQQRIDDSKKPNATTLQKKQANVAEELLFVQENYENYQPWMGEAIEADRMGIIPPPSGYKSHLDFAADENNFDLYELFQVYQTMDEGNNKASGTAPVQQRPPSPAANSEGMKKPPQAAIDDLRSNPSRASEFDQYFGQGSSAKFL
jgi:hypothetical protein